MRPARHPPPPGNPAAGARARILREARRLIFTRGYGRFTMGELAAELGMSKRTLYVHFADKETLALRVVEDVAAELKAAAGEILEDSRRGFAAKLEALLALMADRLGRLDPAALRDLRRFAPEVHRRIEQLRAATLPEILGRLLAEGRTRGKIRPEADLAFATEYHLHAVQGLMQPDALLRLGLTPGELCGRATRLFLAGLLTAAGRHDYENLSFRA
jgi:AcrR family transcriptional regulator